jgi:hypothetical protein
MAKNSTMVLIAVLLVFLISMPLGSPLYAESNVPVSSETLAETINAVLNGIQERNSSWNVIYDQIFCRQDTAVYDNAIAKALNNKDYKDVIFIARLAELNNYTSPTINDSVRTALENMPMTGSFPITYTSNNFPNSFIVYDRYMINAYRYAQNLEITRWNISDAYNDFTKAYNNMPRGSVSGEMLWINPKQNTAQSSTSRYYDEHAETLSMFLLFSLNGINNATLYAEDAWENTQDHWNGKIYGYTSKSSAVECEMGNFAQIITQYQNTHGNIPYFDRVISDLENKLLTNQYNSPGWGSVGAIKHAETNNQLRLYETLGNLIALQMLYSQFTEGNQTNFQNMLTDGWQGLLNSSLFNNNQFSFMDERTGVAGSYNDEASLIGAMTLFLYGIIPQTGSLAINANEERYHDYRTCFPTSQWQFNYTNHSIRIPVTNGNLAFIFGTQKVTQYFPENGVYDIQFSNDWNRITTITLIDDTQDSSQNSTTDRQFSFILCLTAGLTMVIIPVFLLLLHKSQQTRKAKSTQYLQRACYNVSTVSHYQYLFLGH